MLKETIILTFFCCFLFTGHASKSLHESIHYPQMHVLLMQCVFSMELLPLTVEQYRHVILAGYGLMCVITDGLTIIHLFCVNNLDTLTQVTHKYQIVLLTFILLEPITNVNRGPAPTGKFSGVSNSTSCNTSNSSVTSCLYTSSGYYYYLRSYCNPKRDTIHVQCSPPSKLQQLMQF